MIKKFSALICFSELHRIEIFVSQSLDLIEGHWGFESYAVKLGCLFKALLRFEIRAVTKYFCKKGMPPKEIHEHFNETLWKKSPPYNTVKIWTAE